MNEYPRDEFDDVSEHTRREGAHRSFVKLRDPRSGLWTLLICGVLALIVGALMLFVVKPWAVDKSTATTETTATSTAKTTAAPSSTGGSVSPSTQTTQPPSTTSTPTQTSETPQTSEAPTTSAVPTTPSTSEAPAAVLSTEVGVYNGTKISGLAQKSASSLTSAGYTSVRTKNWTKSATTSTVYYKTAAQRATAQAIAQKLGISEVVQTSNIPAAVSVVIGSDQAMR